MVPKYTAGGRGHSSVLGHIRALCARPPEGGLRCGSDCGAQRSVAARRVPAPLASPSLPPSVITAGPSEILPEAQTAVADAYVRCRARHLSAASSGSSACIQDVRLTRLSGRLLSRPSALPRLSKPVRNSRAMSGRAHPPYRTRSHARSAVPAALRSRRCRYDAITRHSSITL